MYEPEELAALESEIERVLATGQPFTFVDIGANVGLSGNFERLTFNSKDPFPQLSPDERNMPFIGTTLGWSADAGYALL